MKNESVLDETVILFDSCRELRGRPTRDQLNNWIKNGIRGITLEYWHLGGKPLTSREAVDRFLRKVNALKIRKRSTGNYANVVAAEKQKVT